MTRQLKQQLAEQAFANGYVLVNGVAMHAEHGERFQIPPEVIKRHVKPGHFVELRVDSPRFSLHQEDAEQCSCPSCHGEFSKPILRHECPGSLITLPKQSIPSRGWGEDFWVRIAQREGAYFRGVVDNALVETRMHGLRCDASILFHQDHILAVHTIHRQELVSEMDIPELKELARWLATQQD